MKYGAVKRTLGRPSNGSRVDDGRATHLWIWHEDLADEEPGLMLAVKLMVLFEEKAITALRWEEEEVEVILGDEWAGEVRGVPPVFATFGTIDKHGVELSNYESTLVSVDGRWFGASVQRTGQIVGYDLTFHTESGAITIHELGDYGKHTFEYDEHGLPYYLPRGQGRRADPRARVYPEIFRPSDYALEEEARRSAQLEKNRELMSRARQKASQPGAAAR